MVMQDTDFWRRAETAEPGLFDFGTGVYGMRAGRREAEQRLRAAQDPLYQQAIGASGNVLTQAGSFDPRAAAAEQLAAQQNLLKGKDAADEQALMRMLQKTGMLGVANYNPGVEGIDPSTVAMNPHLAAFYAGRGARDARMAAGALEAGESQLDRQIKRSGMLQDQAAARQRANLESSRIPSRSAANMNILKGAAGILKNTGGLSALSGMLRGGIDWLGNRTGWWGGNAGPEELSGDWAFSAMPRIEDVY